jgi:hypothetical protein
MRTLRPRINAFWIGIAAAMLYGCSAAQLPTGTARSPGQTVLTNSKTFSYTGAEQTFKVPRGVTQLTITADGAGSATGRWSPGGTDGGVTATIPVTSGEKLAIFVGGEGNLGNAGSNGSGGNGGFNGGAPGGRGTYSGSYSDGGTGGAGASDVRQGGDQLTNRVLVAGGAGGGGGGSYYNAGGKAGAGGGKTGGSGGVHPLYDPEGGGGKGGSQSSGGRGGRGGQDFEYHRAPRGHRGELGTGGDGGVAGRGFSTGGGGGGGGGYYGGGGGGTGGQWSSGPGGGGGGGGGSSYVEPGATHVKDIRGAGSSGDGQIVISW